jgi:hypothetical protein
VAVEPERIKTEAEEAVLPPTRKRRRSSASPPLLEPERPAPARSPSPAPKPCQELPVSENTDQPPLLRPGKKEKKRKLSAECENVEPCSKRKRSNGPIKCSAVSRPVKAVVPAVKRRSQAETAKRKTDEKLPLEDVKTVKCPAPILVSEDKKRNNKKVAPIKPNGVKLKKLKGNKFYIYSN